MSRPLYPGLAERWGRERASEYLSDAAERGRESRVGPSPDRTDTEATDDAEAQRAAEVARLQLRAWRLHEEAQRVLANWLGLTGGAAEARAKALRLLTEACGLDSARAAPEGGKP